MREPRDGRVTELKASGEAVESLRVVFEEVVLLGRSAVEASLPGVRADEVLRVGEDGAPHSPATPGLARQPRSPVDVARAHVHGRLAAWRQRHVRAPAHAVDAVVRVDALGVLEPAGDEEAEQIRAAVHAQIVDAHLPGPPDRMTEILLAL